VPNINLARYFEMPSPLWRVVVFVLMVLTTAAAHAQSPDPAAQAVATFENTTQDYVLMHRRFERQIGPIELSTPVAEINRMIHDLAAAIRAERRDARQGDFFTPGLAQVLRARINDALLEHHYAADDVRAAGRVDGVNYERVRLQVNDTFPWVLAVAMFPCVIEALPPLPVELQYRIVGDHLVLIDIHASLIVDILPHALIDFTARYQSPQGGM
jgi:hypothetical protein